jgi:hypothetical protein
MSLFQICYGPEILSVYRTIERYPKISKEQLVNHFQYNPEGNITSLIDAVIKFLLELEVIQIDEMKQFYTFGKSLDTITIFKRFNELAEKINDPTNPNYVFTTMYYELFVKPERLFIEDLHIETNKLFSKVAISQEKINAWKRMMEYFGLGYRYYNGGYYGLPKLKLMKELVSDIGGWEGPLQILFEQHIHPIIPCIHNGKVFRGFIYGMMSLHELSLINLTRKQDLPFYSYGEKKEWNWVSIGGMDS